MPTVNKICILVASSFFPCSERLFHFTVRTFTLREPGSSTEMCPLMDPGRLLAQSTHRILHCALLGQNMQHHHHALLQMCTKPPFQDLKPLANKSACFYCSLKPSTCISAVGFCFSPPDPHLVSTF